MLECPFCHQRIRPQVDANGFECPSCQNWIRLRVNQDRSAWLEPGVFTNGTFQPVLLVPEQGKRAPTPGSRQSQSPVSARNPPNTNEMDLPTIQARRQQIVVRLRELENSIQRVIGLRNQNRQTEQLRQYNSELSRYTQEQNDLQQLDQWLAERESVLRRKAEQARQTSSSGAGAVIVLGAILAAADIYVFTRMINLHLDPRAILIALVIAAVSGLLTLLVAQFN